MDRLLHVVCLDFVLSYPPRGVSSMTKPIVLPVGQTQKQIPVEGSEIPRTTS
jgi:hypothetical protein